MEDLPPSIEQTTELPSEEPSQLPNPTQQHDDIATMDFVPLEIPQPPDPQPAMNMDYNEAGLRRSQRARKQPVKFKDYIPHEQVAFESLFQFTEEPPQKVQAMKAIHDPDTLYLWEAMKESDADKFLEAMQQEVDDHTNRKHWELCKRRTRQRKSAPAGRQSRFAYSLGVIPPLARWNSTRGRRAIPRTQWLAYLTLHS